VVFELHFYEILTFNSAFIIWWLNCDCELLTKWILGLQDIKCTKLHCPNPRMLLASNQLMFWSGWYINFTLSTVWTVWIRSQ